MYLGPMVLVETDMGMTGGARILSRERKDSNPFLLCQNAKNKNLKILGSLILPDLDISVIMSWEELDEEMSFDVHIAWTKLETQSRIVIAHILTEQLKYIYQSLYYTF